MNYMKLERLPRLSSEETKELVKKNPVLRNLFPKKGVVWHCSNDTLMEGFLSSSRFSNPEVSNMHRSAKVSKIGNDEKVDDDSDVDSAFLSEHNINQTAHKDQKRKFAISLATLSAKPYKRSTIIKDGGIKTLLDLSGLSDSIVRKSCAIAFTLLSKEQSLRTKMIEDGVITALISLSSSHNYYIKTNCCKALCNIFCEPGSEPKGIREGAPQALIRIAAICPDSIELCLKTLLNLSCVPEKFPRIEELNEVLFYFNDAVILNDGQKLLLLSSLCNLSAVRNNQLRLVEDGCLRIVEWAWTSTNPQMRVRGSEIIRNLTTEYRSRGKLVENNLIAILLAMASDELEEVRISAVKALYILSKDVSCRHKIVTASGMEVLVMLSMSTYQNIEIGRTTARVWRILCKDKIAASKAVNFGIVKAFISLLTSSADDQYIQQYIIESICMLLSQSDLSIIEILLNDNIVTAIVLVIRSYRDTVTSEWLAYSLYQITSIHLTNLSIRDPKLVETGVLPSLIKLSCSLISSENTKSICSGCFVNITLMKEVDSANAIPIIVYLLRHEVNMITRMNCSTSLYNLSYNDDNCYQMLDSGVLMPIVEFVVKSDRDETASVMNHPRNSHHNNQSGNESMSPHRTYSPSTHPNSSLMPVSANNHYDSNINTSSSIKDLIRTKIKCAAILSRLTLFEKYYHLFISNNNDVQLLHVLLKLSVVDDLPTQRRVVSALANLTKNPYLRVKLLSLNPISYILSLASKRDEKLWYGCCCIICNLSYEYGSERMMVEGGIIPTLLITALINTDSMSSKIICVKAIANLLTLLPKNHENDKNKIDELDDEDDYSEDYDSDENYLYIVSSMVQDRVIWGLSTLSLLDNFELLSISAKILYRLSYDHARDIMESSAAVKALIKIINYSDNSELLRLGGEMLINILLKTSRGMTALTSGLPRTAPNQTSKDSKGLKNLSIGERDHNFRCHILQHMKVLASSNDSEVIKSCILCLYLISQDNKCCQTIVSSGMLDMITHSSCDHELIFSSKNISLAFLELVNNIAKSISKSSKLANVPIAYVAYTVDPSTTNPSIPVSRSTDIEDASTTIDVSNEEIFNALLNDEILSRFHDIISYGDEQLDITVMKCIYVFSCHEDNIIKLAQEQNDIISMIDTIWNRKTYEKSNEMIEHITAILFNMSIHLSVQGDLVAQGIVKTLVSLWSYVSERAYLDESSIHSITNFALSSATANQAAANTSGGNQSSVIAGGRASIIRIQPSTAIRIHKPVAGLTVSSIHSPSSSAIFGRPLMRLSFSPTSSSFYAISTSNTGANQFNANFALGNLSNPNARQLSSQQLNQQDNAVSLKEPNPQLTMQLIATHQQYMKLCILICSAMAHLGCGNVNSARMIDDGCGPILVFICQSHKNPSYLNYIFDYGVYLRCSASFRNLLLNISNQSVMLRHGCLQGLIDLFALVTKAEQQSIAVETTVSTMNNPNQTTGPSTTAVSLASSSRSEKQVRMMICKNCASGLRSLTYNSDERDSIVSSGAINVILADLRDELADDETAIDAHLLHEIEAESWQNGIRRHQREERAKPITPDQPYLEYLASVQANALVVDIPMQTRNNINEKFHISTMESYEEDAQTANGGTNNGVGLNGEPLLQFQQLDDTIAVVNLKVGDLVSYEDSDDNSHAIPQQYSKIEIDISEEQSLIELKANDRNDRNDTSITDVDRATQSAGTSIPYGLGDLIEQDNSTFEIPSRTGTATSSKVIDTSSSVIEDGSRTNVRPSLSLPELANAKATSFTEMPKLVGTFGSPPVSSGNDQLHAFEKQNFSATGVTELKNNAPNISKSRYRTQIKYVKKSAAERVNVRKLIQPHDKFGVIVAKINTKNEKNMSGDSTNVISDVLNDWRNICGRN